MATVPVQIVPKLLPPAPFERLAMLRERMGTWRPGHGCVVSDQPVRGGDNDAIEYYGGYLVAESITREHAIAIAKLPELLDVARHSVRGREILAAIATELDEPTDISSPVKDGFDGCQRIARLAHDLRAGGMYELARALNPIAAAALHWTRGA